MQDKEDIRKIIEACRKNEPMDPKVVRGTTEKNIENKKEYHANAIFGTKYLKFSLDEDNNSKDKNEE